MTLVASLDYMHYTRLVFTLEKLEMFTCQNEKRALIVHQRFKVFLGKANLVVRVTMGRNRQSGTTK